MPNETKKRSTAQTQPNGKNAAKQKQERSSSARRAGEPANETKAKRASAKQPDKPARRVKNEKKVAKPDESKKTARPIRETRLSDYDLASDILASHKSLVKLYGSALCEIPDVPLREIIACQMAECAEDQLDVFTYMNERGMYKTEPATAQKIKRAKESFAGDIKNQP